MSIVNKHKAPSDIQTPPSGYTTLFIRSDTEVPSLKDSDGNVSDLVIPGDASGVTYTPSEPLNWTDSVDPGNVDDALDDLALRVVTLESAGQGSGVGDGDYGDVAVSGGGTIFTVESSSNISITGGTITGITDLAIADGGTGASTKTAAFDALSPNASQGDITYFDGTNNVALTAGTSGYSLRTGGAGANPSWAAPNPSPPQGRLTLTTATPIMAADVTAATSIYYTPYIGNLVPIYDGAAFLMRSFTEKTLSLDSTNHPIESLYDVFVWNNSGTVAIGAGPSWNRNSTITVTIATPAVVSWTAHGLNEGDPVIFTTTGALPTGITAGTIYYVGRSPATDTFNISTSRANAAAGTFVATSGSQSGTHTATCKVRSRGTGAGTTEITRLNGLWVNANSITLTNGAGAGTAVSANQATYLGTFYTTAAGQTAMMFKPDAASGGTNNTLGIFNAYNQVQTRAMCRDNTASWTYATSTWRSSNNSVSNRISWIDGLKQSSAASTFQQTIQVTSTSAAGIAVNFNSTNADPAVCIQAGEASNAFRGFNAITDHSVPTLGLSYGQAVERSFAGTNTHYGLVTAGRQTESLNISISI